VLPPVYPPSILPYFFSSLSNTGERRRHLSCNHSMLIHERPSRYVRELVFHRRELRNRGRDIDERRRAAAEVPARQAHQHWQLSGHRPIWLFLQRAREFASSAPAHPRELRLGKPWPFQRRQ